MANAAPQRPRGRLSGAPLAARLGLALLVAFIITVANGFAPGASTAHAQASSGFAVSSAVVTTRSMYLRSGPTTASAPVLTLPANAVATVLGGPYNDWYQLDYRGARGYASGKYLAPASGQIAPAAGDTSPAAATPTPAPTLVVPQVVFNTGPGNYTGLMLGELSAAGNIKAEPDKSARTIKRWWAGRRVLLYEGITDTEGKLWYRVSESPEPPMYVLASLVKQVAPVQFEDGRYTGRWVNVNVSQQIAIAYEGSTPVLVTLASTGKGKYATTLGAWKIFWRLPKQDMEGGSKTDGSYYKLKDVPYPQFFTMSGESLHGTYWHDNFGRPMSHGCVNLSTPIAEWFYQWAGLGTMVWVHN